MPLSESAGSTMKEVHLICNAHLDPIWQWEWEEGAAAALSIKETVSVHDIDIKALQMELKNLDKTLSL